MARLLLTPSEAAACTLAAVAEYIQDTVFNYGQVPSSWEISQN